MSLYYLGLIFRDIAVVVRNRITETFKQGEVSAISDEKQCEAYISSLERIVSDEHKKAHPRTSQSTSTGLEAKYLRKATETDFISEWDETVNQEGKKEQGIIKSVTQKFSPSNKLAPDSK